MLCLRDELLKLVEGLCAVVCRGGALRGNEPRVECLHIDEGCSVWVSRHGGLLFGDSKKSTVSRGSNRPHACPGDSLGRARLGPRARLRDLALGLGLGNRRLAIGLPLRVPRLEHFGDRRPLRGAPTLARLDGSRCGRGRAFLRGGGAFLCDRRSRYGRSWSGRDHCPLTLGDEFVGHGVRRFSRDKAKRPACQTQAPLFATDVFTTTWQMSKMADISPQIEAETRDPRKMRLKSMTSPLSSRASWRIARTIKAVTTL